MKDASHSEADTLRTEVARLTRLLGEERARAEAWKADAHEHEDAAEAAKERADGLTAVAIGLRDAVARRGGGVKALPFAIQEAVQAILNEVEEP